MFSLLLAALDTAGTAKELEARPFPFFLALVLGAVSVLWGSLVTVALWGARGQLHILRDQILDLRKERDEAQDKLEAETAKRLELAVGVATTAKGLARIREDLDAEGLKKRGRPSPPGGG